MKSSYRPGRVPWLSLLPNASCNRHSNMHAAGALSLIASATIHVACLLILLACGVNTGMSLRADTAGHSEDPSTHEYACCWGPCCCWAVTQVVWFQQKLVHRTCPAGVDVVAAKRQAVPCLLVKCALLTRGALQGAQC
jgi:hypothetical protein